MINDVTTWNNLLIFREPKLRVCLAACSFEFISILEYIQSLQNQVQGNQRQLQQQQQAKKKKEEMDEMRDLGNIFKPVQEMPKIADGIAFYWLF